MSLAKGHTQGSQSESGNWKVKLLSKIILNFNHFQHHYFH